MSSSAIQVCSNALLLLGNDAINAFSEDPTAITPNLWDLARQATLRLGVWSCCRKRVTLSPLVAAPESDWSYAFTLPPDCLRVVSVGERGQSIEYEIENGQILSDEAIIKLRYVWDNQSVPSWDALLTEAVTLHMATLMAYPLTKSPEQQSRMQDMFAAMLKLARGVNGDEAPTDPIGDTPLLASRFGLSSIAVR